MDGHVAKEQDYIAYREGRFAHIPMIVGSTSDEGRGTARGMKIVSADALQSYVRSNFKAMQDRAVQSYSARSDADAVQVLSGLVSDTRFLYGTREMLNLAAPLQPNLYRYVFTQSRNGSSAKPIHGAELQYVFDNLSAPHRGQVPPSNQDDARVANAMADAWARFAKTGSPSGDGLNWPRSRAPPVYLEFGPGMDSSTFEKQPRLDFMRDFYAARR